MLHSTIGVSEFFACLRYKRYIMITLIAIATDQNICKVSKLNNLNFCLTFVRSIKFTHVRFMAICTKSEASRPTTTFLSVITQRLCR
jgi:hypothetical protein